MTTEKTTAQSAEIASTPRGKRTSSRVAYKMIRPMAMQVDVPAGQVVYWCDACMNSFLTPTDIEPAQCPAGHRSVDFEHKVS